MKLTLKQRNAFFSGKWPKLAGEGKPPVQAGYVHVLSPRLSFEVLRVHIRRGRWRLEYKVIDDRDERTWLMPTGASFACDEDGKLAPMPPEEEIGYSRNPKRRKLDKAPAVPPKVQHIIDMRSRLTRAQQPTSQAERNSQARSVREQLHHTLKQLTPDAQTILLAKLEHEIASAREQEQQAA